MEEGKMKCNCSHHKVVPALIVILGLVFLLGQWGTLSGGAVSTIWPIVLILIGLMKMMSGKCTCCGSHC